MNLNLFELFVKIGVKDEASKNVSSIANKLGNGLKTAAKVGTAAIGVASAAIVGLTKKSTESYAEYEQLVGGVDTLFKDASQKVQQYAADAYKTAGMSANDYMANATAFSASLISSLGGDTEKAAEYANRAMVSMSDNANKMGTSLDSIVQTYQSLSRGNMAMLDNLKLGYGGTKAELERLIADAASYTDIQKEMGVTVDASSMSFDNIVNAIAVVQGKLGIAGATAAEAATTIEGSVNSMKGAWQNLITGVADDNADFGLLVNNFVDSVGTVAENILPRVQVALNGVGDLIDKLFPVIIEKVPSIIEETLPKLLTTGAHMLTSIVDGLLSAVPKLTDTSSGLIGQILQIFSDNFPEFMTSGVMLVEKLLSGIAENIDLIIDTIVSVIETITETLTEPWALNKILNAALRLIVELAYGLTEAIPQLVDAVFNVVDSLFVFLLDPENLAKIINAALNIVIALAGGLIAAIPRLLTAVGQLIKKLIDNFKETDWGEVGENLIDGLLEGLKKAWESIKTWFTNAWDKLFGNKSVDVSANVSGGDVDGSHAGGLDYVPFDGYVAELHKGEQVLTAEEARDYKRGGRVVSVVQNIYSQAKTAADLIQEARYQQERAVLFGV